jgi:hypothetical protein
VAPKRRLLGGMEVSAAGQVVIGWISTIHRSTGGWPDAMEVHGANLGEILLLGQRL